MAQTQQNLLQNTIEIKGRLLQFDIDPEILRQDYRIKEAVCCICLDENKNTHGCNNLFCLHICICTDCATTNHSLLSRQCPICKTIGDIVSKKQRTVVERVVDYSPAVDREQARSEEVLAQASLIHYLKQLVEQYFGCNFKDPLITHNFNLPEDSIERVISMIKLLNHRFDVKEIHFSNGANYWTAVYLPQNIISMIFPLISKIGFAEDCNTSEVFFRFEDNVTFALDNYDRKVTQHELLYILRNIGINKITFPVLVDITQPTPGMKVIDNLVIPNLKRFSITQSFDTTKYKKVFVTFLKGFLFWSSYSPEDIRTLETEAIQILETFNGIYSSGEYSRGISKSDD